MKNFWHFGDSFAFNDFSKENPLNLWTADKQEENFGQILSSYFNANYKFRAVTGASNEQIFNRILSFNNEFQDGDIIFINWSFFTRGSYINKNRSDSTDRIPFEVFSTNEFFDEHSNTTTSNYHKQILNTNHTFIMEYILNYNFDFNSKLFYGSVPNFFKTLIKRNINIYNLFIKENDLLKYGSDNYDFAFNHEMGYHVKFNPSYFNWLLDRDILKEQEGHYKKGVQKMIADTIYSKINSRLI